ncbi:MAG: AI-2E family transporter [Flavobacteriaceae bacterium]|nr:AI-2E family transporter [Flavobacteriaceae bacterium]
MNANTLTRGIVQAFLVIIGIIALYKLLLMAQSLLGYVFLAVVVSLVGKPIKEFLMRRLRFKNTFATILTLLLLLLLLFGLGSLIVPVIAAQAQNLSLLQIDQWEADLLVLVSDLDGYFSRYDINLTERITTLFSNVDFAFIPDLINGFLGFLGGFTIALFSVLFISFFLLKDSSLLLRGILLVFASDQKERIERSFTKITSLLSRYFNGILLQISILFLFYSGVLLLFGIPNALTIALICALFNIIPYIGPLIGGLFMIVLTMTSNLGADVATVIVPKTIYVLIGFIAGQMIDNFFSQPLIFSKSVKSHPLEIFLVIILAGLLAGPVGMLVAVPCYTLIKVVMSEFLNDNRLVRALTKNM